MAGKTGQRGKGIWPVVIAASISVFSTSSLVRGDTTITVGALQDAMMFGTSAGADTNAASGKGPALFAGADGSSNKKRSMLEFDLASANIRANATITSVTMTLYLAQVAGSGGGSGGGVYPTRIDSLYDLKQAWGEGTSGSPTSTGLGGTGQGYTRVTGDSSWDYAFYNSADTTTGKWNDGASDLHGGNFSATASATSTFTNFTTLNAPFTWSSAGMVADVQSWISGATPNYGWMLKSDNLESSATSFLGFWSKDGAAANNNPAVALPPTLSITFTPEPGAFLLIAAGVPILLCRRRSAKMVGQ